MKGGRPKEGTEGGYNWSALASFRGQIDSTAATRMSSRHQKTSLTNEGPCPIHWGNLSTSWPDVNEINFKILLNKGYNFTKNSRE